MDPYSYTNADPVHGPPKVGIPFDPLGEYEAHDTIYTITVFIPDKTPGRIRQWIDKKSSYVDYSNYDGARDHRMGGVLPQFGSQSSETTSQALALKDLPGMKRKVVKLKATHFPIDFRCKHAQGSDRKCDHGCYLLERGGEAPNWKCARGDCEGHRWGWFMKMDDEGKSCFGKKGDRLLCILY